MAARKHEINVAVNSKGAPTQLKVLVERLKKMEQQTKKNRKELRSMYTVMHGKPSKDAAKGLEKLNQLMTSLALNAKRARKEVFALLKAIQAASGKSRNINIRVNQTGGATSAASAVPAAVATSAVGNQARKTGSEVNRMWGAFTGRGSTAALDRLHAINTSARTIATSTILVRRQVLSMFSAFTVGYAGTDLFRTVGDFTNMLRTSGALAGATDHEFKELESTIRELAKTAPRTATQVAEGALYMARAGFNARVTIDGLADALLLSEVGLVDMGRSTDIVTNLLTAFQLETKDLSQAVDVMAHAASSGNISIHQMGEGLKFSSGTAKKTGVSYKELIGLLTALGNAGLPSGIAGRGLNQLLIQLAKKGELINGNILPALYKYKDASVATLKDVEKFENNALRALSGLTLQIPFIEKLFKELHNADGAAKKLAETMRKDNLGYQLGILRSNLEEVYLRFSDFVDLPGIIKSISDALKRLGENIEYLIEGLKAVAVAGAIFFGAKTIGFLASLTAGLLQLNKLGGLFVSLFTGNWVAILGTGASIFVGLAGSFAKIAGFSFTIVGMLTAFKDVFAKSDRKSLRGLAASLKTFSDTVKEIAKRTFPDLKDFSGDLDSWIGVLRKIVDAMGKGLLKIEHFVKNIPETIGEMLAKVIVATPGFAAKMMGIIMKAITLAGVQAAKTTGQTIVSTAANLVPGANPDLYRDPVINSLNQLASTTNDEATRYEAELKLMTHMTTKYSNSLNKRLLDYDAMGKANEAVIEKTWEAENAWERAINALNILAGIQFQPEMLGSADLEDLWKEIGRWKGSGGDVAMVNRHRILRGRQIAVDMDTEAESAIFPEGHTYFTTKRTRQKAASAAEDAAKQRENALEKFQQLQDEMAHRTAILGMSKEQERVEDEIFQFKQNSEGLLENEINQGEQIIRGYYERLDALEKTQSLARTINDLVNTGANTFISSFKRLGDQGVSAAERIKNAFQDAIESIGEQLLRLGFQKAVASLINFAIPGAGLPGFANGGSFRVGGSGGTDSQLVAFRATPNETVSVKTPAQQRMSGSPTITYVTNNFHLSTYEAEHKIQSMINASEKGTIDKAVQVNAAVQRNDPTYFPG